jgi:glutathione S-transferase
MNQPLKLFDVAGADPEVRFSPYCWRIRLALAHKGLLVEAIPWRFSEKGVIAPSGQGAAPVLVDGDKWISDSWVIAEYLETAYLDRPSIFGSREAQGLARFINQWTDAVLTPAVARVVLPDVPDLLGEADHDYFVVTREAAFGVSFAALIERREEALAAFRQALQPLRSLLVRQPFLAGEAPNYADYIVFSVFQFARIVSAVELLEDDDPVAGWRARLLEACNGLAGAARRGHS